MAASSRGAVVAALVGNGSVEGLAAEFGERMLDSLGQEIDRIEAEIVERFPQLRHLDLESHWRPGD